MSSAHGLGGYRVAGQQDGLAGDDLQVAQAAVRSAAGAEAGGSGREGERVAGAVGVDEGAGRVGDGQPAR